MGFTIDSPASAAEIATMKNSSHSPAGSGASARVVIRSRAPCLHGRFLQPTPSRTRSARMSPIGNWSSRSPNGSASFFGTTVHFWATWPERPGRQSPKSTATCWVERTSFACPVQPREDCPAHRGRFGRLPCREGQMPPFSWSRQPRLERRAEPELPGIWRARLPGGAHAAHPGQARTPRKILRLVQPPATGNAGEER